MALVCDSTNVKIGKSGNKIQPDEFLEMLHRTESCSDFYISDIEN